MYAANLKLALKEEISHGQSVLWVKAKFVQLKFG